MKNLLVIALAAAACAVPASAGDRGRTVCVLRSRPVAIQPAPRVVVSRPAPRVVSAAPQTRYYTGGGYSPGYSSCRPYRVPVVYGTFVPRVHYVNPCLPNGYIGGLRNLPSNVIQIPPTFGRSAPAAKGRAK